jgi:2-oxoisovalerate dehydrogenase E1 component
VQAGHRAAEKHGKVEAKQVDLYRIIFTARQMDLVEERYVNRGDAAFSVSGAGHEAIAALNEHLVAADYLHLHYRDKALMLARGIAPVRFFRGLFCKQGSFSEGRQMSAHPAERGLRILSLTGPVGNHALQAVGVAAEIHRDKERPIVVCSMGDGASQQGEVLEAIAEAVRARLPVLFIIEDNRLAISTRTAGKTFYDLPAGQADSYYGLPIHRFDGADVPACGERFGKIVEHMRETRCPAIVHLAVERLFSHTNSDDQESYRDAEEIRLMRQTADPLIAYRVALLARGVPAAVLASAEASAVQEVRADAELALASPEPEVQLDAKRPLSMLSLPPAGMAREAGASGPTMLEAIRGVLRWRLRSDARVSLHGQDIEDPKGDVFGITRGLSSDFPGRVVNSALSEATIVGTAIGRALAGGRPVAFIQFADFLPLAFNQIASELGSMYWRTAGEWECPVIVMVACGGYRDGLGPFHAQTMESTALHVPGIDVFMPSNGIDAEELLNFAFESNRPSLFFYPKACLNLEAPRDLAALEPGQGHALPIRARMLRRGEDLTFVCYGNAVSACIEAADALLKSGASAEVIDLRSLSPWDEEAVIASVEKTGRLIVVHEDNRTCGFGAEVLATVLEKAVRRVQAKRVVREDTYVPCHFSSQLQVLPSFERVLAEAARLLELDLTWLPLPAIEKDIHLVCAPATGPSDQSIVLCDWRVAAGDDVVEGQTLGSVEGMKCVFDFESQVKGRVEALLVEQGSAVEVGTPIARIRVAEGQRSLAPRQMPVPVLRSRRKAQDDAPLQTRSAVGIVAVSTALGSRELANDELLRPHWRHNSDDIIRMTGIHSRRRIADGESVVSLGAAASRRVLEQAGLSIEDIGLVICATGTPDMLSPSVACRVLENLGGSEHGCPAYDISAACTGYLYGLGLAYDHLLARPDERVLLITSEIISPLLDEDDFGTAILFGDAATATILSGAAHEKDFRLHLQRPYLSSRAEPGNYLRAPHADSESALAMDGMKVFEWGVRCMTSALHKACSDAGVSVDAISQLVPHQANQRIIDTVCRQLQLPRDRLYMNLARTGNTSSSSIPICLADLLIDGLRPGVIGMVAFGAGFTYGACLLNHYPVNESAVNG